MGSLLFFFLSISLSCAFVYCLSSSEFIYPNYSASHFRFIDSSGSFLFSRNGTFKAALFNPRGQQTKFYLCVIHVASNTIVWSANRDEPISSSGQMNLTFRGIYITDEDGSFKWSTPQLRSPAAALRLTEMGNLVLLDQFNGTLWESFQHPTDTIVIGQYLPVETALFSAVSDYDLSTGDYKLAITASDAILQWRGLTYWKLSMDTKAYTNSNHAVEYMAINQTGLFLFGRNGSVVIIQMNLPQSDFRIAKLDVSGQFIVRGAAQTREFGGPADECRIPFICRKIGLCSDDATSGSPVCSCPSNFHLASQNTGDCVPADASYSLPVSCNTTYSSSQINSSSPVSYLRLNYGIDYFANYFTSPVKYGVDLSACQDLCSEDCSCLGIFYGNSSGSCYVVEYEFGSIISRTTSHNDWLGFVKTLVGAATRSFDDDNDIGGPTVQFPLIALVLLPCTGLILLLALGFLLWKRSRVSKTLMIKLGSLTCPSSGELDAFSIPGLPKRFEFEELEAATDNFQTKIGSGGFGTVYKGRLPDETLVAVKRITNLGVHGKRDFCNEIAIIGNIHHVNLVKLKGFCAQGRQWLLVYEYMNRGSLDCTLFGGGPVLEWKERVEIALGTARGLAYLHTGCERKIIHCDVKPENILLHANSPAKISDFGLSKLLSPEQSSLFTTMRGTRGYLAPEWLTSSAISDKTDVYSFGMVLLELVSGRKNCSIRTQSRSTSDDNSGGGHSSSSSGQGLVYFPLFALEMHERGSYLDLADLRLEGRVSSEEVEKLVRVALCCVHEEPSLRPNMVSVVGMLEGEIPLSRPRVESLNFLRFYGRRFAEASMIGEASAQNDVMLYPQANASRTKTKSGSNTYFSYISSQQISGPR
ncbi:hypothetical protein RJ639_010690 [Escallonia herrerae]|uniref:Receptor-like serine/threonine-protein kinase n=1 Tax=Escallonia herrerae TaxID=1293975 RepID=A0AA88VP43_9ASTE|nr:hypothetical protein RJ639_010690 [Escallonia herrerae]